MKIISYNVNGIRAAIKKGFWEWMQSESPDIVCLQETKAMAEQVDLAPLHEMGYTDYWFSAQKKGYSGVAIFSKQPIDTLIYGCEHELFDFEGRVICGVVNDILICNMYFPSGTSGDERQSIKYDFLDYINNWLDEKKKTYSDIIVVGDYNIAHTENDIHNPKSNKKTSGFLPEEREWMSTFLSNGWTDAFRHLNPEETSYSWWSYRAGARAKNKGWRIDYQCVTTPLIDRLVSAGQLNDAVHSDHCPTFTILK